MFVTLLAAAIAAPGAAPAPDYTVAANWLCRPGRSDACSVNQDMTTVAADGARSVQRFKSAKAPGFDCFYVYPTVSLDTGDNSDMTAGAEENQVAVAQAARFTSQCRVFAPLYRQVTLTALRTGMMTGKPQGDRALAYADVKAAWDSYLARDNGGRGVILIGHSQGSGVLKQLIANEIDGKPVQRQMIAAYLAGTNVIDGDFKTVQPCRAAGQTGCVVAWVSFRTDSPPPPTSRFARLNGKPAWCVNAAALNGNAKVVSRAIFTAMGAGQASAPMGPWSKGGPAIATTFVAVPGLISTQCVTGPDAGYLAVSVNADAADARTDTIVGDVVVAGQVQRDWGLHLLDMPVVMGDLIDLAGKQGAAWARPRR